MKKFFKVFFIILRVIIVLCLIFLAAYTVFTRFIPDLTNNVSFIDTIKNIAIDIWVKIRNIFSI